MSTSARNAFRDASETESGFVQAMAPELAQRQFRISAVLVALIAAITLVVAFSGQLKPRYVEPAVVKLTIQAPGSIQVHQAHIKPLSQRGG